MNEVKVVYQNRLRSYYLSSSIQMLEFSDTTTTRYLMIHEHGTEWDGEAVVSEILLPRYTNMSKAMRAVIKLEDEAIVYLEEQWKKWEEQFRLDREKNQAAAD